MPRATIPATKIRAAHPNGDKAHGTDIYYAKLAGRLLDDFNKTGVDLDKETPDILKQAALNLACYMEDIVADSGQWRMFSNLCEQMFGHPVPMFHDDNEEYYPDEPSMTAVRFLIWHATSEMTDYWWNTDLEELDSLAKVAYKRLCDEFEDAPINEELVEDIDSMLKKAEADHDDMRLALLWILNNCYIVHTNDSDKLMAAQMEDFDSAYGNISDDSMRWYYAFTKCIVAFKAGPLALYPREYMAALARIRSFSKLAEQLENIEVMPFRAFLYKVSEDRKSLHLLCSDGKEMDIDRREITLDDDELEKCGGFGASFVKYKGEWHLNGVLSGMENATEKWDELCKSDPRHLIEGQSIMGPEQYLQRTNGKRLFFFIGFDEVKEFLTTRMGFNPGSFNILDKNKEHDQPTMVFIDTNEPEECLRISIGYVNCICAPDNPYYDAKISSKESLQMLWRNDCISSGTVLYLLDKDYLPDLLQDKIFCKLDSIQTRKNDARFLLRYIRQSRY